ISFVFAEPVLQRVSVTEEKIRMKTWLKGISVLVLLADGFAIGAAFQAVEESVFLPAKSFEIVYEITLTRGDTIESLGTVIRLVKPNGEWQETKPGGEAPIITTIRKDARILQKGSKIDIHRRQEPWVEKDPATDRMRCGRCLKAFPNFRG